MRLIWVGERNRMDVYGEAENEKIAKWQISPAF